MDLVLEMEGIITGSRMVGNWDGRGERKEEEKERGERGGGEGKHAM